MDERAWPLKSRKIACAYRFINFCLPWARPENRCSRRAIQLQMRLRVPEHVQRVFLNMQNLASIRKLYDLLYFAAFYAVGGCYSSALGATWTAKAGSCALARCTARR